MSTHLVDQLADILYLLILLQVSLHASAKTLPGATWLAVLFLGKKSGCLVQCLTCSDPNC